jgi:hypothetical protein
MAAVEEFASRGSDRRLDNIFVLHVHMHVSSLDLPSMRFCPASHSTACASHLQTPKSIYMYRLPSLPHPCVMAAMGSFQAQDQQLTVLPVW